MLVHSYSNILNELEGFDAWLVSLGLTPKKNDRIHQAIETLRAGDAAVRRGRETGKFSPIQPEHLFPLTEALEALDVFRCFRHESSDALKSTLKRALSGP